MKFVEKIQYIVICFLLPTEQWNGWASDIRTSDLPNLGTTSSFEPAVY